MINGQWMDDKRERFAFFWQLQSTAFWESQSYTFARFINGNALKPHTRIHVAVVHETGDEMGLKLGGGDRAGHGPDSDPRFNHVAELR